MPNPGATTGAGAGYAVVAGGANTGAPAGSGGIPRQESPKVCSLKTVGGESCGWTCGEGGDCDGCETTVRLLPWLVVPIGIAALAGLVTIYGV